MNLVQRIYQHREGIFDGFAKDYAIKRLVWFEQHDTMDAAILREKRSSDGCGRGNTSWWAR